MPSLYSEELRTGFWSKNLTKYGYLFEAAIHKKLLAVAKKQAQAEATRTGYVVVDIDLFLKRNGALRPLNRFDAMS